MNVFLFVETDPGGVAGMGWDIQGDGGLVRGGCPARRQPAAAETTTLVASVDSCSYFLCFHDIIIFMRNNCNRIDFIFIYRTLVCVRLLLR